MKRLPFSRFALVAITLLIMDAPPAVPAGTQEAFRTLLNPEGKLGIVRHPAPFDFGRGKPGAIPAFQPGKRESFQVDLRHYDLRDLDASARIGDLQMADFDGATKWPARLPGGFDPAGIMELGKNPGLGVRSLHARGITGRGAGIAIIDQTLLVDHAEYKDRLRLYEELHADGGPAVMHGPAVASIAVGKSVGVAPGADLYYIANVFGTYRPDGSFDHDFAHLARAIDRILTINSSLPPGAKIRVLSISVGWAPQQKGFADVTAAVDRAKEAGLLVVSSSLSESYGGKIAFHGLGRAPLADPEAPASYGPGLWWADQARAVAPMTLKRGTLLVPMDSRCVASPSASDEFVFYRQGGWSWSIPYIAGLYALACQVKPAITPEEFWDAAVSTGDPLEIPARRPVPPKDELDREIAKWLDGRMAMLRTRAKDTPPEKLMAETYDRLTGSKLETMSEADFRAWAAAGPARDAALADTKPATLKAIANPVRLFSILEKESVKKDSF